jgi:hypothetical protein
MASFNLIILSRPPVWRLVELSEVPHGQALRDLACRVLGYEVLESIVLVSINN